jgi:hypothetical protein
MKGSRTMKTANVVRAIDHGTFIQLLCADEGGLLSVYLSRKRFGLLCEKIHRAGLKLHSLPIKYDRDIVHVPTLGKI